MASNTLQNNFTSGITSKKLMGKYSSEAYRNGCTDIVNFQILQQGGLTRRPGTRLINTPYHESDPYTTSERISLPGIRLIPFCISTEINFIVELGNNTLRVWKNDCSSLMRFLINGVEYTTLTSVQLGFSLYTAEECEDVQFAQDYEHLWITHRNHKVLVLTHSLITEQGSQVSKIEFSQLTPTLAEGDTDNIGLFTGDDCPGKVFYYGSRTWFLSSKNHPYRMWASRPYEYDNFEFYDNVETVDDGVMTSTLENAIKYGEISSVISGEFTVEIDEGTWKTMVENTGVYLFSYRSSGWMLNDEYVNLSSYGITIDSGEASVGDTITVRFYNIDEVTYSTTEAIREDNALLLEVGSARNDEIMWMSSIGNYLIVGTASGEWTMPGSINGLTQQIYQASAYGSYKIQPVMAGNDIIFVQCGGSKLRGYMGSSEGFSCPDLTYLCDGLFNGKQIKHMAWKRVPDPTLYCVLSDGNLAVLFYDRQYSLQGWTVWTFDGNVKDVCCLDTREGQNVYISIERTDGTDTRKNLEVFRDFYVEDNYSHKDCIDDDEEHTDFYFNTPFDSYFITNGFEGSSAGSTIGRKKRIYEANLRVINTHEVKAMCYWGELDKDNYVETKIADLGAYNVDDIEIAVPGGYQKWIGFKVQSVDDKMLTALALSLMTEVE